MLSRDMLGSGSDGDKVSKKRTYPLKVDVRFLKQ